MVKSSGGPTGKNPPRGQARHRYPVYKASVHGTLKRGTAMQGVKQLIDKPRTVRESLSAARADGIGTHKKSTRKKNPKAFKDSKY